MADNAQLTALIEQVKQAQANQQRLYIRGGGSKQFYGEPLPQSGDIQWLDMSTYQGIVSYEPTEMVMTVRAGTPLAEIETALAEKGQMLSFEPPRFNAHSTIGGAVATGLSGPARMAVGPVSDFVLGTRLLTAQGEDLRFGGEVMKNVAGYDISRLLTGSLGILGALLEVSIKVMPKPYCQSTQVLELDEPAALDQSLKWRSQQLPITGTTWLQEGSQPKLYVRLGGNDSAVKEAVAKIGGQTLEASQAGAFWDSIRDQLHAFFSAESLWRLSLPPKAKPLDIAASHGQLHEWGGCLRWLTGDIDASRLRQQVESLGGTASLFRRGGQPASVASFHPLNPVVAKIQKRIKHEMDAQGIFNYGRLLPNI